MAKEDTPKSENQANGKSGVPGTQSGNSSVSGSDQAQDQKQSQARNQNQKERASDQAIRARYLSFTDKNGEPAVGGDNEEAIKEEDKMPEEIPLVKKAHSEALTQQQVAQQITSISTQQIQTIQSPKEKPLLHNKKNTDVDDQQSKQTAFFAQHSQKKTESQPPSPSQNESTQKEQAISTDQPSGKEEAPRDEPKQDNAIQFTGQQISNLQNTLHELFTEKINEQYSQQLNQETVGKLIESTIEIFVRVASRLLERNLSLRDIFYQDICTIKESQAIQMDEFADKTAEIIDPNKEIELLKLDNLIFRMNEQLLRQTLKDGEKPSPDNMEDPDDWRQIDIKQEKSIMTIFQNGKYYDLISYDEVCRAFNDLGVSEGRPILNQNMRYDDLSLKSIRILNRLIDYIEQNQLDIETYMADIVQKQIIKTKSSSPEVEIFMAKRFFTKLHNCGIKKRPNIIDNLCKILCIDQKYKYYLMLKRLKRCWVDFRNQRYFRQIGTRRRQIDLEEYHREVGQQEYDDENEDQEMNRGQRRGEEGSAEREGGEDGEAHARQRPQPGHPSRARSRPGRQPH